MIEITTLIYGYFFMSTSSSLTLNRDVLSRIYRDVIEDQPTEKTYANLSSVDRLSQKIIYNLLNQLWGHWWEGVPKSPCTPFWQRIFLNVKLNLENQWKENLLVRFKKLRVELYNYGKKIPFLIENAPFVGVLQELQKKNDAALHKIWGSIKINFGNKAAAISNVDEIREWMDVNKELLENYKFDLFLSNLGLEVIPIEITRFKSIKTISLYDNLITVLPSQLCLCLKNLEALSLRNNCIERIPESFTTLPKVKELDLKDNLISHISPKLRDFFKRNDVRLFIDDNPLLIAFDPLLEEDSATTTDDDTSESLEDVYPNKLNQEQANSCESLPSK
jgi:Leucine-rich repeat (LRR) protein